MIPFGETEIPAGTKKYWFVKITEGIVVPVEIPIAVVRGSSTGPILAILAGVHGTEYVGVDAVLSTYSGTDPKNLRGTLILVPVANVLAFQTRSSVLTPGDEKNLNRVFPGNPDGTISDRLADFLYREVASRSNCVVDIHGGDSLEYLGPMTVFCRTGDDRTQRNTEELAKIFGFRFAYDEGDPATKGTVGQLMQELPKSRIPAIQLEVGGGARPDSQLTQQVLTGVTNVMKYLKMVDGPLVTPVRQDLLTKLVSIRARKGGFVRLRCELEQEIQKGEELGEIVDLRSGDVEKVVAPMSGFILGKTSTAAVNPGETLVRIGLS